MAVVIIESPGKKKSIEKYTGHKVIATFGHMKDLPKTKLGVNLQTFEGTFEPKDSRGAASLKSLVNACRNQDVYIATDGDREGEAIGAMVFQEIEKVCNNCYRSVFGEVTEGAVKKAIKEAIPFSEFDWNAYNSFLGRRIGDRLVGYLLSGIVHNKSGWISAGGKKDNMSVGRVQTIGVKAIVARKKEIDAFIPTPFLDIEATFVKDGKSFVGKNSNNPFNNILEGKNLVSLLLQENQAIVSSVEKKPSFGKPKPPYITSTIQAHGSTVLGLSGKQTMFLLQKMYEGFGSGGFITYMRTDSPNISQEYSETIGTYLSDLYPDNYSGVVKYKNKQSQAEAHECLRPVMNPSEYVATESLIHDGLEQVKAGLGKKGVLLFQMICNRTLASQLDAAEYDKTFVKIKIKDSEFKVTGSILTKQGHLILKQDKEENEKEEKEELLPNLNEGDILDIKSVLGTERSTTPPSEYTEPSLIKKLEKEGIGRPSTYATIVDTLFSKNYAIKNKGKKTFTPTAKAFSLITVMDEHYDFLVDFGFTASLEEDLDKVAEGTITWQSAMKKLYIKMGSPNPSKRSPSAKMLIIARKLSESGKEAFDESQSEDFTYVSEYLNNNFDKTPSAKQLSFAESISATSGINLPDDAKKDYTLLGKWIDKNMKNAPKPLSEKQKQIIIDNGPEDIVALLNSSDVKDIKKTKSWIDSFFKKSKKK